MNESELLFVCKCSSTIYWALCYFVRWRALFRTIVDGPTLKASVRSTSIM